MLNISGKIIIGDYVNIELESIRLTRYQETKHKDLKEDFDTGESHSNFVHQIPSRLETSKNNNRSIYQSAFVVEVDDIPLGYLYLVEFAMKFF